MLKSELPHEAPNAVSKKEARVHRAARRRGSLAAHRSCVNLEATGEEAEHALNAALGDGHMTHSRQRRRDNHEQGNNN